MKIGLSLSLCVLDIFLKKVDIKDIVVIVARTDFNPEDDKQWKSIWDGYANNGGFSPSNWVWGNHAAHEVEFRQIILKLHKTGRLHQPRQYGAHPPRIMYHWLETLAPEEDVKKNPAVKKAWENYKMLAGLS